MYTPCPCFSCGKQITYMWSQNQNIDLMLVEDAIETDIYGSYGSRFDLAHIKIWICDDCIEEKMEERVFMVNEDVNDDYTIENGN
jgi:hypothetical protein